MHFSSTPALYLNDKLPSAMKKIYLGDNVCGCFTKEYIDGQ